MTYAVLLIIGVDLHAFSGCFLIFHLLLLLLVVVVTKPVRISYCKCKSVFFSHASGRSFSAVSARHTSGSSLTVPGSMYKIIDENNFSVW